MADLSDIKRVIISLMNLYPNGIAADIFNKAYEGMESQKIPFAEFGYHSLLTFLEEELSENIRIEYGDMQQILYPIANGKSDHILKLKKEENNNKKPRPRAYNGNNNSAHASQQATTSRAHQAPTTRRRSPVTRNRSPSMPHLVQYKPFANTNNGLSSHFQQKSIQERLQQSQERYLLRQQGLMGARGTRGPGRNLNTHSKQSNDSSPSSGKRSSIKSQLEKINIKIQAKKEEIQSKNLSPNGSQPLAQAQTQPQPQQKSPPQGNAVALTAPAITKETTEKLTWESSNENLWDDELDNLEPPTAPAKNKANTDDSSFYYGVSDTEEVPVPPSSVELLRQRMADPLFSDEEEETEQNEIKGVLGDLHIGDTVPVRLSDANSPLKFWVHVRQEKYKKQIDTMYKDMQEFYSRNRHSDDLKVTEPDESNQQYFAVNYMGQWHRVEPLDTKMGESLRVSFIDHGSREIINISQMRKLPKQFWSVPKAALCCALGNIKPMGKEFTNESVDALINLLDGEKLWARILQIDNIMKF
ncbi:tudor domain-containing 6-like isoform X2 [Sitodiplosis mosellana]|uniref:tudor domain-containing 6-like isoform X2 n=1 Tax=Sitodiplosis mosellana TaxID=263140 RepID=UPI002444650A|nr:tudor domain-containing 6-like isoform X2 [Sitodiplosis mosellana]